MMRRRVARILFTFISLCVMAGASAAHPLGNFSISHFARIQPGADRIRIRYVVDMAEIPAFQELRSIGADAGGTASSKELEEYADRAAERYRGGLQLEIDGVPVAIELRSRRISLPPGVGGLPTLRIECDYEAEAPVDVAARPRRLRFENSNMADRIGWREIVVVASGGISVFNSDAFGSSVTDELKAYPEEMLAAPLDERVAEFSFVNGAAPQGATALLTREGTTARAGRDRFAELIAAPELTLPVVLLGLFLAAGLGAAHALSPGHGKAVVGAYLVGSRGTPRHAAFLGLTVTITHTVGVFALGLLTLVASQYVVPERLFPVLSLVSGAIVLVMGLSLLTRRLRALLDRSHHSHEYLSDEDRHHLHGHEPGHHRHGHP